MGFQAHVIHLVHAVGVKLGEEKGGGLPVLAVTWLRFH